MVSEGAGDETAAATGILTSKGPPEDEKVGGHVPAAPGVLHRFSSANSSSIDILVRRVYAAIAPGGGPYDRPEAGVLVVRSLVHPLKSGDLVRTVDDAARWLAGALTRALAPMAGVGIRAQLSRTGSTDWRLSRKAPACEGQWAGRGSRLPHFECRVLLR